MAQARPVMSRKSNNGKQEKKAEICVIVAFTLLHRIRKAPEDTPGGGGVGLFQRRKPFAFYFLDAILFRLDHLHG